MTVPDIKAVLCLNCLYWHRISKTDKGWCVLHYKRRLMNECGSCHEFKIRPSTPKVKNK